MSGNPLAGFAVYLVQADHLFTGTGKLPKSQATDVVPRQEQLCLGPTNLFQHGFMFGLWPSSINFCVWNEGGQIPFFPPLYRYIQLLQRTLKDFFSSLINFVLISHLIAYSWRAWTLF